MEQINKVVVLEDGKLVVFACNANGKLKASRKKTGRSKTIQSSVSTIDVGDYVVKATIGSKENIIVVFKVGYFRIEDSSKKSKGINPNPAHVYANGSWDVKPHQTLKESIEKYLLNEGISINLHPTIHEEDIFFDEEDEDEDAA